MLSGIGPADKIKRYGVDQLIDSPAVGSNHSDHLSLHQAWKLRHPERGLAMGSPAFSKPEYSQGFPVEWLATMYSIPTTHLREALDQEAASGEKNNLTLSPQLPLSQSRVHMGLLVVYAPMNLNGDYEIPLDGTHVSSGVLLFQPTSCGRISLASNDPTAEPVVDPQFYSTLADK